jgi:hypothetical protein
MKIKKGGDLYDDASKFGVFEATIGLIVGIIFSIIMISISIYLLLTPLNYNGNVIGTVKTANCSTQTSSGKHGTTTSQSCNSMVNYLVNNITYSENVNTGGVQEIINSQIQLVYDEKNPNKVFMKTWFTRSRIAYILILLAIVIIIFLSIQYYIVTHYKFAAAATGVSTFIPD